MLSVDVPHLDVVGHDQRLMQGADLEPFAEQKSLGQHATSIEVDGRRLGRHISHARAHRCVIGTKSGLPTGALARPAYVS